MRNFLLILFLLFCLHGFSQQLLPIQYDTNRYEQEFILNGTADFGSTSLNNEMSGKLLFGGYIDDRIKDNSFSNHKGINRFGTDVSSEIEYRNMKVDLLKKENLGFIVKGGYYNYLSMLYAKDLFGLIFYGNENYLGENASFTGSRFSMMAFQKIGFGVIDKRSKSNVTLNFYTISNYFDGNIREGALFQSSTGDSVSLTFDGDFEFASNSTFVKGFGLGVDLDFRIPVIFRNDRISYIQFLAKNLGVAHLTKNVTKYAADTIFTYDGLTFDQLYGEGNVFKNDFSILDSLGVDSTSTNRTRFLPGYLQVGKMVDDLNPSRFQSFFGIRMYPSIAYVPMIYAGVQIKTTKWLDLGLNISYGGYTQFRSGLYTQFKLKNFAVGIASEDLIGVVSKKGRGQSVIIRLRYKL